MDERRAAGSSDDDRFIDLTHSLDAFYIHDFLTLRQRDERSLASTHQWQGIRNIGRRDFHFLGPVVGSTITHLRRQTSL